jgi:hypothetical protein
VIKHRSGEDLVVDAEMPVRRRRPPVTREEPCPRVTDRRGNERIVDATAGNSTGGRLLDELEVSGCGKCQRRTGEADSSY